ncbi:hypothetical protein AB0M47_09470 [Hamadaea sp. NPDC051192]|uniref:hypothetical protein n=1 Tax=Hamadaea sp. NPDC051192 TaxID=3154940 RepID=UPI00342AA227
MIALILDTSALVLYCRAEDPRALFVGEMIASVLDDAEEDDTFIGIPTQCMLEAAHQLSGFDIEPLVVLTQRARVVVLDQPDPVAAMRMAATLRISPTIAVLMLAADRHPEALIATFEPLELRKYIAKPRRVIELDSEYPDGTDDGWRPTEPE